MSITRIPHKKPGARDAFAGLVVAIAAVVALFLLGVWAVSAQEVAAPGAGVADMRPAAVALIEWLGVAAGAVVNVAGFLFVRWLSVRSGLDRSRLEAEYSTRIGDLLHKGIEYAITTAKNEAAKSDSPITAVKLDNWFLGVAASYVNKRAPELLGYFKIDEQALQEMIIARMPAYFTEVPVTGGVVATPTAVTVGDKMGIPAAPANSGQPAPAVVDSAGTATNAG